MSPSGDYNHARLSPHFLQGIFLLKFPSFKQKEERTHQPERRKQREWMAKDLIPIAVLERL